MHFIALVLIIYSLSHFSLEQRPQVMVPQQHLRKGVPQVPLFINHATHLSELPPIIYTPADKQSQAYRKRSFTQLTTTCNEYFGDQVGVAVCHASCRTGEESLCCLHGCSEESADWRSIHTTSLDGTQTMKLRADEHPEDDAMALQTTAHATSMTTTTPDSDV
jgi:hypothetical protein